MKPVSSALISLDSFFRSDLLLPDDAISWLLDLWCVIQLFDDVADGDPIDRGDLDCAIIASLILMPTNPFYRIFADHLSPVVMNAILKWKASDDAERAGQCDQKSYMWRASYYDVILTVTILCKGQEFAMSKAESIMHLYGESFDDYRKEFENA